MTENGTAVAERREDTSIAFAGGFDLVAVKQRAEQLVAARDVIEDVIKNALVDGVDYGTLPGTQAPMLYKGGAEKIQVMFGMSFRITAVDERVDEKGHLFVRVTGSVSHIASGSHIADGTGSANTMEERYRNRWVFKSDIPEGINPDSLQTKEFTRKDGSGKFYKYLLTNDDPYTLYNTVLKMAEKRAHVDAVQRATATSGRFAQETDVVDPETGEIGPRQGQRRQQNNRNGRRQGNQPRSRSPLSPDENNAFWADARAAGLTREQTLALFDGRQLSECTREEVDAVWDDIKGMIGDAPQVVDQEGNPVESDLPFSDDEPGDGDGE